LFLAKFLASQNEYGVIIILFIKLLQKKKANIALQSHVSASIIAHFAQKNNLFFDQLNQ
jgi:hypothetical protein